MKKHQGDLIRPIIFGIMLLALLFGGCNIIKPAVNKSSIDSTTVNLKPVDVPVKGAKVNTSLNVDSLVKDYTAKRVKFLIDSANAAAAGKPIPKAPQAPPQKFTDPQTKAELTYWMDAYGRLQIGCESKDQTVRMMVAEIVKLTKQVTDKVSIIKETPVWNWITIAILGTILAISLLVNFITIRRK